MLGTRCRHDNLCAGVDEMARCRLNTLALWIGPPVMAVVVVALGLLFFRTYQREQAARSGPEALSPTARAQLDALVEQLAVDTPQPKRKSGLRAEFGHPFDTPDSDNDDSDNRAT